MHDLVKGQRLRKDPERALFIVMRYLGDVLLTTPLIHSIRSAYPACRIDVLVFSNTAGILEGNPDIDTVIETRQRTRIRDALRLLLRICRRYDLSFVTQTGDRPFFYSLVAAPIRVGAVPPRYRTGWWKRLFLQYWTEFDDLDTHTVLQHLKLADLIGIRAVSELVPPRASADSRYSCTIPGKPRYAVLHVYPQRVYKRWTVSGWAAVGRFLAEQNIRLVLSGSPDKEEIEYVREIHRRLPDDTLNLAGNISLAELAGIIRNARLFIGPDTGITHLAAATGIPVISLFGPTNPVKWAPWPFGFKKRDNPFGRVGSGDVNNIYLLQGEKDCVPCHLEGCDRHRNSHSECLNTLPATRVIEKIRHVLSQSDAIDSNKCDA